MGLLNSFFWLVYGLALSDLVIFTPNFCGFILSIIQLILCGVFSSKIDHDGPMSEQLVEEDSTSFGDQNVVRSDNNLEML